MKNHTELACSKKGAAASAAVCFAFLLAVIFVLLLLWQPSVPDYNQISFEEKQAHFAARAAMQHFVLKARLLNKELFEAVRIAQGKNPNFSFDKYPLFNNVGEPVFKPLTDRQGIYVPIDSEKDKNYYLLLPNNKAVIRLGSYFNPAYRFLARGCVKADGAEKYLNDLTLPKSFNAKKYLKYFIRDCTNDLKDMQLLQPPLETRRANSTPGGKDFDIKTSKGCPYTMTYTVTSAEVLPKTGLKSANEERVEVFVRGAVISANNKKASQTQKHIHFVSAGQ